MKPIFKSSLFALSLASVALLSACGGGGSDSAPPPPANQPAWGSPAMFVPAGSSQVAIAVSGCTESSGNNILAVQSLQPIALGNASTPVNSPSLVITAAGDVIFSGALGAATSVSELARVNFASTSDRTIDFNSDAAQNGFYVESISGTEMAVDYGRNGTRFYATNNATYSFNCSNVTSLTPAYAPSEARLAAKFTAGATSWGLNATPFTTTTIANSLITWNNQANNTTLAAGQTSAKYASLNVATGALNVGPNASQVTQSVAISAAAAAGGSYREADFEDRDFAQGRAKSVELSVNTTSQGVLKFDARAGDNMIIVIPSLGTYVFIPPFIPAAPL